MKDHVKDYKYVVFKRDELGELPNDIYEKLFAKVEQVEDAVVIRTQDVFAPPALDAYANSIQVALSLGATPGAATHYLREVADYFHTRAAEAWEQSRKVPD